MCCRVVIHTDVTLVFRLHDVAAVSVEMKNEI